MEDRKALEALVVDNDEFEELERELERFNIFEALGATRHELRHSDFLAFLLSPDDAHSFGDMFLRRLLQRAVRERASAPGSTGMTPVELDVLDLDGVEVRREWRNIDILLLDDLNKFAVIIENKIDSAESEGQLARYWEQVEHEFSGYRILGLFLTPHGDEPSDTRYAAINYGLVADVVERLAESRASTLGPDVLTTVIHYGQMLRRHIVSDSEIAKLCRRIYEKHRRALDLIFEHRPDRQATVRALLEKLIGETPGLILDDSNKTYIRFAPAAFDIPRLKNGAGWTKSGRILLFQFDNGASELALKLIIGPGDAETRERLYNMAMADPGLFQGATKGMYKSFNMIFKRTFSGKNFEDIDGEVLESELRRNWTSFVEKDLPRLIAKIEPEESLRGS